jgi:uncharacterized membrane protein YfcA
LICPYLLKAAGLSVPIGALAGLVGLGGGEFRLPVLVRVIGFGPKSAVPLNLCISLATLAFALATRSHVVSPAAVLGHLPEVIGLAGGGVISAFYGTGLVRRLSDRRLLHLISALLVALGLLLISEAFFGGQSNGLIGPSLEARALAGFSIGLAVGVVSSVLGVAGGELLIPALIFVFGVDIKVAGTASILISLVIVAIGIWRYGRAGAIPLNTGAQRIGTAMAAGSLLGAILGGLAVAVAPTAFLKIFLGAVLVVAGLKSMRHGSD